MDLRSIRRLLQLFAKRLCNYIIVSLIPADDSRPAVSRRHEARFDQAVGQRHGADEDEVEFGPQASSLAMRPARRAKMRSTPESAS